MEKLLQKITFNSGANLRRASTVEANKSVRLMTGEAYNCKRCRKSNDFGRQNDFSAEYFSIILPRNHSAYLVGLASIVDFGKGHVTKLLPQLQG